MKSINVEAIEKVALALEEINDEVIYVGGAVISFYINDLGANEPRPTTDIDISVQVSSYSQMNHFSERLASKRIFPAVTQSVMYRYTFENILIDIIPFDETPLGPTNKWLKPGFKKAKTVTIGKTKIKILPVSLFLASKWEAFKNRGNDPRLSHDFEDIVTVLDNNTDIISDFISSEKDVQLCLSEMCNEILLHSSANELIECHLTPINADKRRDLIIQKMNHLCELL